MVRFLARRIIIITGILLLCYGIYALYVWFVPRTLSETVAIEIPAGQRVYQTLELLAQKQVIRNPFLAGVYLSITGRDGLLQAGDYTFSGRITLSSVLDTLTQTQRAAEVTLTFREGLTGQEMAQYLREQGHGAALTFVSAMQIIPLGKYPFLSTLSKGASLEGFLFPDTYRVFPNATASDIISGMLENFDHKFTQEMRDEIKRQKRTIFDVITLASIVEKEVANDDDRAVVAGIFYKRIEEGMRLESDATVNYVTGKGLAQPSFADTDVDSPYNTYAYRGIPPGPIYNPGLSSINAVIYYKKSPYLFFLTTKDEQTIFSKTYEEHLANKRKYLDK